MRTPARRDTRGLEWRECIGKIMATFYMDREIIIGEAHEVDSVFLNVKRVVIGHILR